MISTNFIIKCFLTAVPTAKMRSEGALGTLNQIVVNLEFACVDIQPTNTSNSKV